VVDDLYLRGGWFTNIRAAFNWLAAVLALALGAGTALVGLVVPRAAFMSYTGQVQSAEQRCRLGA
jgi:hypothetical protein